MTSKIVRVINLLEVDILADGNLSINGGESGTNVSHSIYAYLIFGGVVADSAQVKSNGTYGLKANPNTTYTVMISSTSVAIGNSTPSITTPPVTPLPQKTPSNHIQ